jgi:hypothetical protein
MENGGFQDTHWLSAPDNSATKKHYDRLGDFAFHVVANWKLRRDMVALMKLLKERRDRSAAKE